MDDSSFDDLTKSLSKATSRRQALKVIAGAVGGAVLAILPGGAALAIAPGRCRRNSTPCRQSIECCSGFCDPVSQQCACEPGSIVCPSSGACVPACEPTEVFNAATCQCERVCFPGEPCIQNSDCCQGFTCRTSKGGQGVCMPGTCANPDICATSAACCPGFFCSVVPGTSNGVCLPLAA
jgi:hypothetical protein